MAVQLRSQSRVNGGVNVAAWRTLTVDGQPRLAMLGVQGDGKWTAVIYRDPNAGPHYVRGESFISLDEAIANAVSLLGDVPQLEAGSDQVPSQDGPG